jgi:P27 family predicted phage terminase small subunit
MTKAQTNRPAPPEDLDGEGLLEWQRVCDELHAAGRLDKTDRAVLTLYAETWQTWRANMRGVNQHGAVIKYSNGMVGPSPFFKVAKETAAQLRGLLNDMGLTPASRGKAGNSDDAGDLEI